MNIDKKGEIDVFDPVKANEDFEREWYEMCVSKAHWEPVRASLHRQWGSLDNNIYRLQTQIKWLAIACGAEGAAILVLLKLLLTQ